jgi:NADPH-dependent curcumin reductase CurA
MRGWLDDKPSYQLPVAIGDVVRASTVGQVVASRNLLFPADSFVTGLHGVQDYVVAGDDGIASRIVDGDVPLTHHLSVLGSPGVTAYFGMTEIGRVAAGQTVLVSAAAGAVGSLAGQIAKINGARTIGIAGGPEKCSRLKRYGYDVAIDYRGKDQVALAAEIAAAAPDGVNLIFENVGGPILDAGLMNIARDGRIALCGLISDYNRGDDAHGSRAIWQLIVKRATMQGFLFSGFLDRFDEGVAAMRAWSDAGLLSTDLDIEAGIENAFLAFIKLFDGTNQGKMLLALD